jgi:hypothetical protein
MDLAIPVPPIMTTRKLTVLVTNSLLHQDLSEFSIGCEKSIIQTAVKIEVWECSYLRRCETLRDLLKIVGFPCWATG